MEGNNKVVSISAVLNSNEVTPGASVDTYSKILDNDGGGEPPMDNKYVTHQELELSNEKLLHHIDNRFNDMDKNFNKVELEINDLKNTANTNKEKINWVLYTLIGGIIASVLTTLITKFI